MNNIPSKPRALAAVAMLVCLASLAVPAVPAAQAQQSGAAEQEIAATARAEMQARLAALNDRLMVQMRAIEALQGGDRAQVQRRLEELAVTEARMREQAAASARRAGVVQERTAEETARRYEELRRAMVAAEESLQRARGVATARLSGGCEVFGDLVIDYAEDLELTDDQVQRIRDVERAARRDAIARNADIQIAEMDLETLYEGDEPDLTAIRAKLEELARQRVDGEMAGLGLRQQVRGILTPAQLEQLEDLRSDGRVRVVIAGTGARGWRMSRVGC